MRQDDAFVPDRTLKMLWGEFSYSDGGGGRPVILLHGMGCSRLDWEPVLPLLSGRRLIRPDLCGHGGSSVPRQAFALADLAYDVLALMDELWLGRVDLVGHSLGGMLALLLLRHHAERIGRVALVEGWTSLAHSRVLGDAMDGLDAEQARAVSGLYHRTFVRWPPLLREKFWRTVDAFDATDVLAATTRQVLEIYGDRGRERPAPEALGVPRRPNVRLAWIPGGTHYPARTHPRALGRLLADFLGATGGGKGGRGAPPPPSLLELAVRR